MWLLIAAIAGIYVLEKGRKPVADVATFAQMDVLPKPEGASYLGPSDRGTTAGAIFAGETVPPFIPATVPALVPAPAPAPAPAPVPLSAPVVSPVVAPVPVYPTPTPTPISGGAAGGGGYAYSGGTTRSLV
jgi:hypothetical protein